MAIPYRLLPPLGTLRAFEAAARHENFTLAADDLCLTQSAVSRHVRALEESMGVPLFIRHNRKVQLTPDGRRLMEAVTITLSHLSLVTQDIRKRNSSGKIKVAMLAAQASLYVIPRMARFRKKYPDIDINIVATEENPDPRTHDYDISIVCGYHGEPGFHSERILTERAYPVCSPDYLASVPSLRKPADLLGATLLHIDEAAFVGYPWQTQLTWKSLLAEFGVGVLEPLNGLTFSSYLLTVQAALRGLGVAIGWHHIVADFIEDGSLVCPFPMYLEQDRHHYLVVPENRMDRSDVREFCNWLRDEIRETFARPDILPVETGTEEPALEPDASA